MSLEENLAAAAENQIRRFGSFSFRLVEEICRDRDQDRARAWARPRPRPRPQAWA